MNAQDSEREKKIALMKCGCVATAVDAQGRPVCVVHIGLDPRARQVAEERPDLTGRMALCGHRRGRDGKQYAPVPSSWALPFFEYQGPGSPAAEGMCVCGFHRAAHASGNPEGCTGFHPQGPYEYDTYYCGCWGWD